MRLPTRSSLAVSAAQQRIKTNEKKIAEWRAEKDRLEREKKAKQKQGGILPLLGTVAGAGLGLAAGGPAGAIAGAKAGAGIGGFIEKPTVASGVGAAEGLSYFTDEAVATRKLAGEKSQYEVDKLKLEADPLQQSKENYQNKGFRIINVADATKYARASLQPVSVTGDKPDFYIERLAPSEKDVAQTGYYDAQAAKARSETGKVAKEKIDKDAVAAFEIDLSLQPPSKVLLLLQRGNFLSELNSNDVTKAAMYKSAKTYLQQFNEFQEINFGEDYRDYLAYLRGQ